MATTIAPPDDEHASGAAPRRNTGVNDRTLHEQIIAGKNYFPATLARFRKLSGKDIREFSELVGLEPNEYARLERGDAAPPNKTGFIRYACEGVFPTDAAPDFDPNADEETLLEARRLLMYAYDVSLLARAVVSVDILRNPEDISRIARLITAVRLAGMTQRHNDRGKIITLDRGIILR